MAKRNEVAGVTKVANQLTVKESILDYQGGPTIITRSLEVEEGNTRLEAGDVRVEQRHREMQSC